MKFVDDDDDDDITRAASDGVTLFNFFPQKSAAFFSHRPSAN